MNFVVYLVLLGQYCLLYVRRVVSFDEQKAEARRGLFRDIVLFSEQCCFGVACLLLCI